MTTLTSERPLSKPRHRRPMITISGITPLSSAAARDAGVECLWFDNDEQSFCLRDVVALRPTDDEGFLPLCLKHHDAANQTPQLLTNRRGHRSDRRGADEHRHPTAGDEPVPKDALDAR